MGGEDNQRLVEQALARLRQKLLDLSNRNRLLNFRNSERARTHVRIIATSLDAVYRRLAGGASLEFVALPEPEPDPPDERTDEFRMAVEAARKTDPDYLSKIFELDDEQDPAGFQRLERALKDRVRVELSMPPRPSRETMDPAEYARVLGIDPRYDLSAADDAIRATRAHDNNLQTLLFTELMERKLSGLRDQARQSLQETGISTLFVVYGFLEWTERGNVDQRLVAPLLLQPAELERRTVRGRYRYFLKGTSDEPEVNLTLSERLRRDFGIDLPPFDGNGEPGAYLDGVAEIIDDQPGWRVRHFLTVGVFSFGRLVMWHDLDPNRWPKKRQLQASDVLAALFTGEKKGRVAGDIHDVDEPEVAKLVPPLVADADSSQLSAIIDALKGVNLAIKGPPGTGKSQTITNLIAAGLASGRRVLFVAEKMAALEVVKKRLDDAGLGHFCLELHSTKAKKRDVIGQLERRLRIQNTLPAPARLGQAREQLERLKADLGRYVSLLNTTFGAIGKTIQRILGAELRTRAWLQELPPGTESIVFDAAISLSSYDIERAVGKLKTLQRLADEVVCTYGNINAHPWFGVNRTDLSPFEEAEIRDAFVDWHAHAKELIASLGKFTDVTAAFAPRTLRMIATLVDHVLGQLPARLPAEVEAELMTALADEDFARRVDDLIGLLEERSEIASRLSLFAQEPERLLGREDLAARLSELVDKADLDERTVADLDACIEEARGHVEGVAEMIRAARSVNAAFGLEDEPKADQLRRLVEALELVAALPRDSLSLRTPGVLDDSNLPLLEEAAARAKELSEQEQKLTLTIRVDRFQSCDELRRHAFVLSSTGLFGRLGHRYRSARAVARELMQSESHADLGALASALRQLAAHLEDLQVFEEDKRIRRLCWPAFQGIHTKFDLLVALCDYARKVREFTRDGEPADLKIRGVLLAADDARLRELAEMLGRRALQPLVRWLCSTPNHGDLTDVRRSLERRLATLEQISQEAGSIGLTADLPLARVADLHSDLKLHAALTTRVEGLAAAGARLNELGVDAERREPRLKATVALALRWHELLASQAPAAEGLRQLLFSRESDHWLHQLRSLCRELQDRFALVNVAAQGAMRKATLAATFFSSGDLLDEDLAQLERRLGRAIEAGDSLAGWLEFRRAWHDAEAEGPAELFALFERLPRPERMVEAYRRVFYRSLARLAYDEHPELRRLSGVRQEEARRRFRALDADIRDLERQQIAAELCRRPIKQGTAVGRRSEWKELALVRQQIALQKGHRPIRKLMTRAGRAVQDMMPCFMMSPISVAQFLEPSALGFDLVVIDEASQMPPEEAVGAIARGSQLVVVGDPMQLPPTAFFQRLELEAESDEDEDLGVDTESILDLSLDVFHPFRELRWHYRSRHESLIAFSNRHFYDDRLIVFPTPLPSRKQYGVRLNQVRGTYLGHGINRDEVKAVCDAVVQFMQRHPGHSLGVVTLNRQQAELLRDEFERLERREPAVQDYLAHWEQTLEPFFIKNLENVQGDERDVIFISTVYGPDARGNIFQRFGPINSPTGHRRLNVLFTRAKECVEVFASLAADDILADGARHRGVSILRDYLAYAATGRIEGARSQGDADSDFELFVAEALTRRGYEVEHQIGVAGFFIDLGVRHPLVPAGYLVGIECDGASYHAARSARDRDVLRQEILERLGWRILRVWSTDWFRDPRRELDRLCSEMEHIAAETAIEAELEPAEVVEPTAAAPLALPPPSPVRSSVGAEPEPCAPTLRVEMDDWVVYAFTDEPKRRITIKISPSEHDPDANVIHASQPIALALLGGEVGDELPLEVGGRRRLVIIIEIRREEILSHT